MSSAKEENVHRRAFVTDEAAGEGGAIICAWALSVSLSMMFDFTIEEARQNFRQGSFIFGAAVVFAFVFRSKVQTWGAFEKFLIYALVPVAGILLTAYGWCQQFAPELVASLGA